MDSSTCKTWSVGQLGVDAKVADGTSESNRLRASIFPIHFGCPGWRRKIKSGVWVYAPFAKNDLQLSRDEPVEVWVGPPSAWDQERQLDWM